MSDHRIVHHHLPTWGRRYPRVFSIYLIHCRHDEAAVLVQKQQHR